MEQLVMVPAAIEQAKDRLSKAERALDELIKSTTFQQAESAWVDFLTAASSIYSKLEQGAKGFSKSEPWYGRKRNERRKDPLLSYLHHARNSTEHGITRVVDQTPANRDGMGRQLKFNERTELFKFQAHDPKTGELKAEGEALFAGPTLKPIRVTDDRFGNVSDPPRSHLGREIPFCDFADGLAKQALIYLRELVAEAETLS
jgi:hypothetical protein